MWLRMIVLALITISIVDKGDGARILGFFPMPIKSHHRVFQPLLRALAERGHHVTYFTPIKMDGSPPGIDHLLIPDYLPKIFERLGALPGYLKEWLPTAMGWFGEILAEVILPSKEFQDLVASDLKFDLVLSELSVLHEAFSPLIHRFDAHYIEVLPSGNLHYSWSLNGNPYDTSYIIDTSVRFTDHMTLWQRVHNTFNSLAHRFISHHCFLPKFQRLADRHFRYKGWEERPPISQLLSKASIVLVNSHVSLNYPYPQATNFKDIGGINLQPEVVPLSKELKEFIDGAKDGLIYFTLGSHAQVSTTLDAEQRKVFAQVFGSLKQRVLWKWEQEFPDLPPNVKISKWFPQQTILADNKTRLFITHGGFLSMTEAVYNAVPLIAIPLMGDQFKNTKHIETYGYGIPLYLNNITEGSLRWAIEEIITQQSYSDKAKRHSQIFRDKPETGLETAVYWTEYVIRHKGAHHLRPAVVSMPWYQQAMIDVYAALAIIFFLPLYIVYKIVRRSCNILCKLVSRKEKKKRTDQKKLN